jgi:uncharacterized protein
MVELSREFKIDDLNIRSMPLRQRLWEQAEVSLSHPVDIFEVAENPNFNFLKINGYDPAHDRWHVRRVLTNAETIGSTYGVDLEVVQAAAILHDLITFKKPKKSIQGEESRKSLSEVETDLTAEYIQSWLKEINFPEEKIPLVQQAIRESSFYRTFLTENPAHMVSATSKEAEVLFDADKLDQGGVLGLMRYAASSGRIGRELFDEKDPICEKRIPDVDKYGIDLCRERSLELKRILYTSEGRNIAKRRDGFLNKFLIKLKNELKDGDFGEAQIILRIFENSGKKGMQFYNSDDPFRDITLSTGEKRKLEPEKYPFDALLENSGGNPFIQEFIEEFRLELAGK